MPTDNDFADKLLAMFADQHKERMEEARALRISIDKSNDACRELHATHNEQAQGRQAQVIAKVQEVKDSTPGKWEWRTVIGFLMLMVAFVLVLYAQSQGQDVGEAVDATKRLVPATVGE